MNLDDRARRAADDVKAAVATTDLEALRDRVRAGADGPAHRATPRRQSLAAVAAVAAVVVLVLGIALGVLLARHGQPQRFSSVGSAINGANDVGPVGPPVTFTVPVPVPGRAPYGSGT